ncbi:hypothetical protein CANTEDRAFT_117011 [Yamadazyma tenuis ATCC 10573]|uniref:UPF1 domain-containing protein n=1 Tax=Candida tenuis (strain ATCC 10573 / BCRC 21748 / CBS 615 / JCM 9827 / NBRC 10315 / NRRL Y-1498 / VKM Y-70) TaxID=590646 RepID=G3BDF4_CANTC|nr:uncharacterized protein CANTEDRAFT_117011 [Yamadazyma tenuis ATCC 10573]EGV60945.1 hypothetical protein CANTEDRAFT_117011 [Yamadazyma tenuis ATCC 10573]
MPKIREANPAAIFTLFSYESSFMRVAVGDEVILRYHGLSHAGWESGGVKTITQS